MRRSWIKLYVEILDDPKIGKLTPWLKWRFMELLLVAAESDGSGLLAPVVDIAWRLRVTEDDLIKSLRTLSEIGVVRLIGDRWMVTNFEKRQAKMTGAERVQEYRRRERESVTSSVTKGYKGSVTESSSTSSSDSLIGGGVKGEEEFTAAETASAIASFGNNGAQACARLYQKVTGQVCIPPNQTDKAMPFLQAIIDASQPEPNIEQGRQVYAQWCSTQSQTTGRNYSRLNTAWLGK